MQAQWPQTDWLIHLIFGTLSSTMTDNDDLELIATRNLEDGDDPDVIVRRLIPLPHRHIAALLPALQSKRSLPGRRAP